MCDSIVKCMKSRIFISLPTTISCCKVIANLSANHPNNTAKLGSAGAVEALCAALRRYAIPADALPSSSSSPEADISTPTRASSKGVKIKEPGTIYGLSLRSASPSYNLICCLLYTSDAADE